MQQGNNEQVIFFGRLVRIPEQFNFTASRGDQMLAKYAMRNMFNNLFLVIFLICY